MNKDGCSFVTFHNLSLDPGKYRLLYISEKKDTLLGISEVFQVSSQLCVLSWQRYICPEQE